MNDNKKVVATSNLLVPSQKSSRLTAIRNGLNANKNKLSSKENKAGSLAPDVTPEIKKALIQANQLIEEKINSILSIYPNGKKDSFFKLKYGVKIEQIKTMSIKNIFLLLALDASKIRNFQLIQAMSIS